jgi:hypothetical protein
MAASLYEPAFAIVTRGHASAERRLRPLATVTLFGGLASTVFLPLTAGVVTLAGWRGAAAALAVLLAISAALMAVGLTTPQEDVSGGTQSDVVSPADSSRAVAFLAVAFSTSSFASASFVANLIPTLGLSGFTPTLRRRLRRPKRRGPTAQRRAQLRTPRHVLAWSPCLGVCRVFCVDTLHL